MFQGPLGSSILKRAIDKGVVQIALTNIRDYARDKHQVTDDYPYGGGSGMVMKPEPVYEAIEAVSGQPAERELRTASVADEERTWVVLMTPQGKVLTQEKVAELAGRKRLMIVCGHYEGFDERIRFAADEEISIGDYVLTGGEIPAMVVIDAVVRLLPGVLGDEESAAQDSFSMGILEWPQYTRPRVFRGMEVPEILLSGDHEKVRLWRRKEALRRTLLRRPDLLERAALTREDEKLLAEIEDELGGSYAGNCQ